MSGQRTGDDRPFVPKVGMRVMVHGRADRWEGVLGKVTDEPNEQNGNRWGVVADSGMKLWFFAFHLREHWEPRTSDAKPGYVVDNYGRPRCVECNYRDAAGHAPDCSRAEPRTETPQRTPSYCWHDTPCCPGGEGPVRPTAFSEDEWPTCSKCRRSMKDHLVSQGEPGGAKCPDPFALAAGSDKPPHIQVGLDVVNHHLGVRGKVTRKGDQVKIWIPGDDGNGVDKSYLHAGECAELSRAFASMAHALGGEPVRESPTVERVTKDEWRVLAQSLMTSQLARVELEELRRKFGLETDCASPPVPANIVGTGAIVLDMCKVDGCPNRSIDLTGYCADHPREVSDSSSAATDCECTDGTDPDEPADRGFVCVHKADADRAHFWLRENIPQPTTWGHEQTLTALLAEVRAEEREACARVCEQTMPTNTGYGSTNPADPGRTWPEPNVYSRACAENIRARTANPKGGSK